MIIPSFQVLLRSFVCVCILIYPILVKQSLYNEYNISDGGRPQALLFEGEIFAFFEISTQLLLERYSLVFFSQKGPVLTRRHQIYIYMHVAIFLVAQGVKPEK
jgi:hypothetical protein